MKGIVLKPRAENYSMDELKSMESINSRLYFQIQDYLANNRNRPLFLVGGRGFGKTFNVLKAIMSPEYIGIGNGKLKYGFAKCEFQERLRLQEKAREQFARNERKRKKRLKQSLKSPTVFIFKKNEKQEIWKPIEGTYIKSKDLNEVFDASSMIVFDDIHYICEKVINKELPTNILISLFKNILKTSRLKIPVIMISDEMLSWYAGQIASDELDELILAFGEVSFRKMQEIPKCELKSYLNKRDFLAKLELPPITYKEFDSLFKLSGIDADDFVKEFLYHNSNGNPRGFAKFVSVFHSKEITTDDLIRIAKRRLSKHAKYHQYLQLTDFPKLSVHIDDVILSRVSHRFKTFKNFYIFAQKKLDSKIELYKEIDLNCRAAFILLEKKDARHVQSEITYLLQLTKNSRYVPEYKKLMKHIKEEFSGVFEQIPEIPELTKWKPIYNKYIDTCDSLVELEEELGMSDVDFENFWKKIPYNYSNGILLKPFLIAFNKELEEGWYLNKKGFTNLRYTKMKLMRYK